MEELTKKDILNLLGENITSIRHDGYKGFDEEKEIDEMPIDPSHREWQDQQPDPDKVAKKTGKVTDWTRLYATDDNGKTLEHVGWFGRDTEGKSVPLIFTCEWEEVSEKHPNLVPTLKEKYGAVNLVEKTCMNDKPRGGMTAYVIKPYPGSDEVKEVSWTPYQQKFDQERGEFATTYTTEKINKSFNTILKSQLEDDKEFNDALKKFSFPKIIVSNNEFRNRYTPYNNLEIVFQSHNINLYNTLKEFQSTITNSLREPNPDNIPEKEPHHLRRQYNKLYRNWGKTRFTRIEGFGLTPVFKLDKGDFPNNQKFEVMVSSDITVTGKATELNENNEVVKWTWEVHYKAEYAKKPPTSVIAKSTENDIDIRHDVTVTLSEPKKFDGSTNYEDPKYDRRGNLIPFGKIDANSDKGQEHPLTDVNIVEGLKQVLNDFKQDLINPKRRSEALKRGINTLQHMAGQRPELNENQIKNLVKKIITELK